MDEEKSYDCFLSYSRSDTYQSHLVLRLYDALKQIGTRWYVAHNRYRIFVDRISLAHEADLWETLDKYLLESRILVLLCSPQSAISPGVRNEVSIWLESNSCNDLILIKTDGDIVFNRESENYIDSGSDPIDWQKTNALPLELKGIFEKEPIWLDMSESHFAEKMDAITLGDAIVLETTASIADSINEKRGIARSKEQIITHHLGEQRKKTTNLTTLSFSLLAALIGTLYFWQSTHKAERQASAELSKRYWIEARDAKKEYNAHKAAHLHWLGATAASDSDQSDEHKLALQALVEYLPKLSSTFYHNQFIKSIKLFDNNKKMFSWSDHGN